MNKKNQTARPRTTSSAVGVEAKLVRKEDTEIALT